MVVLDEQTSKELYICSEKSVKVLNFVIFLCTVLAESLVLYTFVENS